MEDRTFSKIKHTDPKFKAIREQFLENQKAWREQNAPYYFDANVEKFKPKKPNVLKRVIEEKILPYLAEISKEEDPSLETIAQVNKLIDNYIKLKIYPRGALRELNTKKFYKKRLVNAWIECLGIICNKLQNSHLFPEFEELEFSYAITMNYSSVQVIIANNSGEHPFKYSLLRGLPIFTVPVKFESVETYCTSNEEKKLSTSAFYQNLRAGNIRSVKRGGASGSWLVSSGFDVRSTASKKQEYSSTLYLLDEVLDEPVINFLKEFDISTDTRFIRIWQQSKDAFIVETYKDLPIFDGETTNFTDLYTFNGEARRVFEDYLLSYTGISPLFDLPIKTVFL